MSVLDPAGLDARRLVHMWWMIFWMSLPFYVAVVGAAVWAIARHRARSSEPLDPAPGPRRDPVATGVVAAALVLVGVLLGVIMLADFRPRRALRDRSEPLTVKVTGHQGCGTSSTRTRRPRTSSPAPTRCTCRS